MQHTFRDSTAVRYFHGLTPWVWSLVLVVANAAIALAPHGGGAEAAGAPSWPLAGTARPIAVPMMEPAAPDFSSDLGTEFDPFILQGSQRWDPPGARTLDPNSALATE